MKLHGPVFFELRRVEFLRVQAADSALIPCTSAKKGPSRIYVISPNVTEGRRVPWFDVEQASLS
jgi:hypothetical protein